MKTAIDKNESEFERLRRESLEWLESKCKCPPPFIRLAVENIQPVTAKTEQEQPLTAFMQTRDLTDEEWLKLPKEEILQLYKNCYKMLMNYIKLSGEKTQDVRTVTSINHSGQEPQMADGKSATDVLRNNMSDTLWTFISTYPVAFKADKMLKDWIIDAMEEYASQHPIMDKGKTAEEQLNELFNDLQKNAYNLEYHNYYYKEANQIIRKYWINYASQHPQITDEEIEKEFPTDDKILKSTLHNPDSLSSLSLRELLDQMKLHNLLRRQGAKWLRDRMNQKNPH